MKFFLKENSEIGLFYFCVGKGLFPGLNQNVHYSTIIEHEIISEAQEPLNTATKVQIDNEEPIDIYLPEPKTSKSMLKLPKDIKNFWLRAIKSEYDNLIRNETFI